MVASYPVLSRNVYRGPQAFPGVKLLDKPEPSKANLGVKLGTFSYGLGKGPTYVVEGDSVLFRTSSNLFEFALNGFRKYGNAFNNDDRKMDGWKFAGEDNPPSRHNVIPKMPDIAYITGITPLRMYFPNVRDTPVNVYTTPRIVEAVDPNKLGVYVSKDGNFRYDLRKWLFDDVFRARSKPREWIELLAEEGFSVDTSPNAEIIGLGIQKGNFFAAYYSTKGLLVVNDRFHKAIEKYAKKYGVSGRDAIELFKEADFEHEIAHRLRVKSEELQGLLRAKSYARLAKQVRGTKLEKVYRTLDEALAKEGLDYAKSFSWYNRLLEAIIGEVGDEGRDIAGLENKFLIEALERGIKDIDGYVRMRLEETVGPILAEASYKSRSSLSKYKSKSGNRKSSQQTDESLEETVESSNEAPTPLMLIKGGKYSEHKGKVKKTYNSDNKIEYRNMENVKGREASSEIAEKEAPKEAETSQGTMAEAA